MTLLKSMGILMNHTKKGDPKDEIWVTASQTCALMGRGVLPVHDHILHCRSPFGQTTVGPSSRNMWAMRSHMGNGMFVGNIGAAIFALVMRLPLLGSDFANFIILLVPLPPQAGQKAEVEPQVEQVEVSQTVSLKHVQHVDGHVKEDVDENVEEHVEKHLALKEVPSQAPQAPEVPERRTPRRAASVPRNMAYRKSSGSKRSKRSKPDEDQLAKMQTDLEAWLKPCKRPKHDLNLARDTVSTNSKGIEGAAVVNKSNDKGTVDTVDTVDADSTVSKGDKGDKGTESTTVANAGNKSDDKGIDADSTVSKGTVSKGAEGDKGTTHGLHANGRRAQRAHQASAKASQAANGPKGSPAAPAATGMAVTVPTAKASQSSPAASAATTAMVRTASCDADEFAKLFSAMRKRPR